MNSIVRVFLTGANTTQAKSAGENRKWLVSLSSEIIFAALFEAELAHKPIGHCMK
jgi:hypothetical protein